MHDLLNAIGYGAIVVAFLAVVVCVLVAILVGNGAWVVYGLVGMLIGAGISMIALLVDIIVYYYGQSARR